MYRLLSSVFLTVAIIFASMTFSSGARAQFTNGSIYLGPELGISLGYGGGVVLGAMGEAPITNPGTVGSGRLAIAGRFDYYSWSDGYYSYSYVPIGVFCDYHLALDDSRWDPFFGAGLGYVIVSASYNGPSALPFSYGYGSTAYIALQIGARYFFSPNMAVRAEWGIIGYSPLGLGLDFKL